MENSLNATRNITVPSNTWVSAQIAAIQARAARHMVYRETVRELSGLSDRALADLGLSRSMIRSVAREAAAAAK